MSLESSSGKRCVGQSELCQSLFKCFEARDCSTVRFSILLLSLQRHHSKLANVTSSWSEYRSEQWVRCLTNTRKRDDYQVPHALLLYMTSKKRVMPQMCRYRQSLSWFSGHIFQCLAAFARNSGSHPPVVSIPSRLERHPQCLLTVTYHFIIVTRLLYF